MKNIKYIKIKIFEAQIKIEMEIFEKNGQRESTLLLALDIFQYKNAFRQQDFLWKNKNIIVITFISSFLFSFV